MTLAQDSGGSARETVAEEIRSLMGRHKVSGNRLAVMTGMTQSSMSRRLAGTYPFTVDELEVIADAFGVPITALFGVRHQGLEPRTRWFGISADSEEVAKVLQFPVGRVAKPVKEGSGKKFEGRRLCAHADQDEPGRMHWLEPGERCSTRTGSVTELRRTS